MFATDLRVTIQQIGAAFFRRGRDDYCATSFVYCRDPQPVPRLDVNAATADIGRRPYEQPGALEVLASFTQPPG